MATGNDRSMLSERWKWSWVASEEAHADPTRLPSDGRLIDPGRGESAISGFSRFHLAETTSKAVGVLHAADVLLLRKEFLLHVDRAPDGRRADVLAVDDQMWWEGEERPPMQDFGVWRELRVPELRRENSMALLEKTSVRNKLAALRGGVPVGQSSSSRSSDSDSSSRSSDSDSSSRSSDSDSDSSSRSSDSDSDRSSRSGCTRATPQQDEFAFLRLVDYRPPWEAFRQNGVYDDFYAVLRKDQSVTWEPGQLLRSHRRECARAVERWLELYEWHEGLAAEQDPAPAWAPRAAAETCDSDKEDGEPPCAATCEPDEAEGEPPRAEGSSSPRRAENARVAVWGSLVKAGIPVATWVYAAPGECKRRKVTCHRSRANPELFYCWNQEGSLQLSQLHNAMISSRSPGM